MAAGGAVGQRRFQFASGGRLSATTGCHQVWRRLLGQLAVSLGFLDVPGVVVDQRTEPVGFWVLAFEKLDVAVDVGQGVLPVRRRKFRQGNRAVTVTHGVVWVEFYGSAGVLYSLVRLRRGCDGMGMGPASPVSGVVGFEFYGRGLVCESFVVVPAVHISGTPGLVHSGHLWLDSDCFVVGANRREPGCVPHVGVALAIGGDRLWVGQSGWRVLVDISIWDRSGVGGSVA